MSKKQTKSKSKLKKIDAAKDDVTLKLVGYITAAFGLVAGLAWNDAVKAIIETYGGTTGDTITAKVVYAIVLSVVVAILSIGLTTLAKKFNDRF